MADKDMHFSSDESDLEIDDKSECKSIHLSNSKQFQVYNNSSNEAGILCLPPEIIYEIFSYIKTKSLLQNVVTTSRYFYDFICSDEFMHHRLADCISKSTSNPTLVEEELSIYKKHGMFKIIDSLEQARSLTFNTVKSRIIDKCHFGDVHCVKILDNPCKNIAISGSRDKSICVYQLDHSEGPTLINTTTDHAGWVWTLDQEEGKSSRVVSGSWDSFLFLYDVGRGSLEKINDFMIHSAALCSKFETNFILSGTYSKLVIGIDVRSGKEVLRMKHHTKPVLGLASSPNFIWSTGEDNALSCFDRRAGKLFKRIRLERISSSIQYQDSYLWLAGFDGKIKVFNSAMRIISKYDSGHTKPITGMSHGMGVTATASKDGTVRLFSPNAHGELWKTFHLDHEVTAVDCKDGFLVAGGCGNVVRFWWNE